MALYNMDLYFTYFGLLRCLITSRSPVARHFQAWATDVLFAAHMGSPEQREIMSAQAFEQRASA